VYEFATVILLGLAVFAVVSLLRHIAGASRAFGTFVDLAFGLALSWITDYSAFAGWGVRFRSLWMGPVLTGLVIGGIAVVWREVLGLVTSIAAPRSGDEPTEIESRIPSAA
jgi:hypothetical protein